MPNPLQVAFAFHPRRWRDFFYAYPVISRRSKGLSIGINLNPDGACNFDCLYCSVDRTITPPVGDVDLERLDTELRWLLDRREALFDEPEFRGVPAAYRRLNDVAFSGDGEPTASPLFNAAARLVAKRLSDARLPDVKIVVITDACYLTRPAVAATLAFLDDHCGEVWAKLDAGTEAYFREVNRPNTTLQHVLDNILAAARIRPIVIQSLFMMLDGAGPGRAEIEAYVSRLRDLLAAGASIRLVQVYTVARRVASPRASPLAEPELELIAARVRELGLAAEVFS
ncbi:Radical SAM superfamily protein [Phycisphaerae bacterium RAS1]|nr:Radical SAM superfamily protein [Phycisphaerae bacterium RAS1]